MVKLRLARVLHGPNRNRTLRRFGEMAAGQVDSAAVEQLFRRFWQLWRGQEASGDVQPAIEGQAISGME